MDEDEWLESDEGQRWAAAFERSGKASAESMRKLASATENLRLTVSDMEYYVVTQPDGLCARLVSSELARVAKR